MVWNIKEGEEEIKVCVLRRILRLRAVCVVGESES
jgi:hypothetical protein